MAHTKHLRGAVLVQPPVAGLCPTRPRQSADRFFAGQVFVGRDLAGADGTSVVVQDLCHLPNLGHLPRRQGGWSHHRPVIKVAQKGGT